MNPPAAPLREGPASRGRFRRRLLLLPVLAAGLYFASDHFLAARRLAAARDAERRREFAGARAELEFCLDRWPFDPDVRLLAARVEWRSRLDRPFVPGWDRAARDHLEAAHVTPGRLDRFGLERSAIELLNGRGSRSTKTRLIARARAGGPDEVPLLEALARSSLDSHQFADVYEFAGGILRRAPDHALAHFWRGLSLELAGRRRGEADEDYRRAVELDPKNYIYRLRLAGNLALRKEHLAEARELLAQLREENPDDGDVLQPLAEVFLELGETANARLTAERAVKFLPADGNAAALLGRAALAADDLVVAESHLRAAVGLAPGSHAAHFHLSQLLSRLGKWDEARAELGQADRIKAERDALAVLYRRVREHPDDPQPRYELGVRNRRLGDSEVGTFWLRSALEIDPEFEPARRALARPSSTRSQFPADSRTREK